MLSAPNDKSVFASSRSNTWQVRLWCSTHLPPDRRRAFTLTELLVVVAIMSLLASLLLPATNHARGKARDIQCLENQRQILVPYQLAMETEFRGEEVRDWFRKEWAANPAWVCPNAPVNTNDQRIAYDHAESWSGMWFEWDYDAPRELVLRDFTTSYTLNFWLSGDPKSFNPGATNRAAMYRNAADITFPTQTPVFGDGFVWVALPWEGQLKGFEVVRHGAGARPKIIYTQADRRNHGGNNLVFFDGHCELVPAGRLWRQRWNRLWEPSDGPP